MYIMCFIFSPCPQPLETVASDCEDVQVAREGLENLTVCIALAPPSLDALGKEAAWRDFINDMLLLCRTRSVEGIVDWLFFVLFRSIYCSLFGKGVITSKNNGLHLLCLFESKNEFLDLIRVGLVGVLQNSS